jgi:SAM-dependent methyltransferase
VKKWWERSLEKDGAEGGVENIGRRLARVNANTAIPIEIAGGHSETDDGQPGAEPWRVDERFLNEEHHQQYGRPWALGKYIHDFVVAAGLLPQHRLLDFGCGALRFGIWVIPYLDEGNYFGVDSHLPSLEAATAYEAPLHGLDEKRPRLLWSEEFAFSHFETPFDVIVDFASSSHFGKKRLRRIVSEYVNVLAPGGRLLTSPPPELSVETLAEHGLTFVRGDIVQPCLLLEGHEDRFRSHNVWVEFTRA